MIDLNTSLTFCKSMDVLHKCKETCSTFRICMGMGVCFGVYSCKCTTQTRGNKYKVAGASFFSAFNMTLQSLLGKLSKTF